MLVVAAALKLVVVAVVAAFAVVETFAAAECCWATFQDDLETSFGQGFEGSFGPEYSRLRSA